MGCLGGFVQALWGCGWRSLSGGKLHPPILASVHLQSITAHLISLPFLLFLLSSSPSKPPSFFPQFLPPSFLLTLLSGCRLHSFSCSLCCPFFRCSPDRPTPFILSASADHIHSFFDRSGCNCSLFFDLGHFEFGVSSCRGGSTFPVTNNG